LIVLPLPENGSVTPAAQATPVPSTVTAANAAADSISFFLVVMLLPFTDGCRAGRKAFGVTCCGLAG